MVDQARAERKRHHLMYTSFIGIKRDYIQKIIYAIFPRQFNFIDEGPLGGQGLLPAHSDEPYFLLRHWIVFFPKHTQF